MNYAGVRFLGKALKNDHLDAPFNKATDQHRTISRQI